MNYDVRSSWPIIDKFLEQEGLAARAEQLFADPKKQRMSALCYVQHEGRVLMLRRNKPPFARHWTAPGGKLHADEQPRQAIVREVHEETQLTIRKPKLRLIASETGGDHYNWLVFFFAATPDTSDAAPHLLNGSREMREGLLDWLPEAGLADENIPGVERLLLPYILTTDEGPPHFARIHFDDDNDVCRCDIDRLKRMSGA